MEKIDYVGLFLTKIVQIEGSGWEQRLPYVLSKELDVQDLDDLDEVTYWMEAFKKHYYGIVMILSGEMLDVFINLFKQLRVRQRKLEYIYFCCDNELPEHYYSSLLKFKSHENS